MLGNCLEKVNDSDGAIAAYLNVGPGCGAASAMIVDACLSAGQVAQEASRLDTAKTAYESALKVCFVLFCCCSALKTIFCRCFRRALKHWLVRFGCSLFDPCTTAMLSGIIHAY
jgi:hypothetical protein